MHWNRDLHPGLQSLKSKLELTKFLSVKVALFSRYIEEYVDFVKISGALGVWPLLLPLDPPLKVMTPRPLVNK